jgi:hypothetical protein
VSEKDFEYYDDKKIQALAIMDRPKSSTQAHVKSDNLNLTVPVKKEDLSLLEIKQEKKAEESHHSKNQSIDFTAPGNELEPKFRPTNTNYQTSGPSHSTSG